MRLETPSDESAVRALVAAAFEDEISLPALLDALRASPDWLGLSYVAESGGEIVGHVALTRALLDARERLVEVLVLAPLSVHPDHQVRGIGRGLVEFAMADQDGRGRPLVFLEGSPRYYGRCGFVAAEPLGYRRPSLRIPGPAFQVRAVDGATAAAGPAGTLVYSRVFWDHDCVGLRDPFLQEMELAFAGE